MEIGEAYQLKSKAIPYPKGGTFQDLRGYREKQDHIKEEFMHALFEEYDVIDNPKAEACFDLAYNYGRNEVNGFADVESYFSDFVDLIIP